MNAVVIDRATLSDRPGLPTAVSTALRMDIYRERG
jgi:hypothetical protein